MITEDYVSFETAKLLKEKGFDFEDYERYGVYVNGKFHRLPEDRGLFLNPIIDIVYNVPTLQTAMKWLREVHNIIIEPESVWNGKKWEYLLFIVTPQNADSPYYEHNPYKSYEECVEAAIKYCLENLI
jgi:hypothetical protein